jgi:hypothetical protein
LFQLAFCGIKEKHDKELDNIRGQGGRLEEIVACTTSLLMNLEPPLKIEFVVFRDG